MAAAAIPLVTMAVSAAQKGQEAKAANERYKNDMTANAAVQQYSPWTHIQEKAISGGPQNVGNSMFAGGMGGLGAGIASNQKAQDMGGWGSYLGLSKKPTDPMEGAQQKVDLPSFYSGGSSWANA